MDLLMHLFYFVGCCVFIAIAWLVYLFFNNLIDRMERNALQGFVGTATTVVLFAVISGIIYLFALSFFVGLLFVMFIAFLVYAGKKAFTNLSSTQAQ